jgi:hypothetical protein
MDWRGSRWAIRALVGTLAVLLPAGAWAAVRVAPGPSTVVAGGRAGATGLGQAAPLDEPAPAPAAVATSAPTTLAPAGPTTTAQATTVTTAKPRQTTTTTSAPTATTTTTLPARLPGYLPAASSWKAEVPGLKLQVRMEPEVPVAGQVVRFHLSFSSAEPCCHVFMHFGDEDRWILHNQLVCTYDLPPGDHSVVVSHTYAAPGAYLAEVRIHDGDLCKARPTAADQELFHHIEMPACVAVGPKAAATGCPPPPPAFPMFSTPPTTVR